MDPALPELTCELEEGFVDLRLKMGDLVRGADNRYRFDARALHQGHTVAFAVVLGAEWPVLDTGDAKILLRQGEGQLISVGSESDAFIQVLNELYGTTLRVSCMRSMTRFTAVSLKGNPERVATEPLKIKVFFESDDKDLCAEFYLNCDTHERCVQFREKDHDYRRAIIIALSPDVVISSRGSG